MDGSSTTPPKVPYDLTVALLDGSSTKKSRDVSLCGSPRWNQNGEDQETCLEGLRRGLHLATSSNCKTGKPFIFDLLNRLKVLKCDCDWIVF
ncbi:hypothetical protein Bca4012_074260 [Brassica carinata]